MSWETPEVDEAILRGRDLLILNMRKPGRTGSDERLTTLAGVIPNQPLPKTRRRSDPTEERPIWNRPVLMNRHSYANENTNAYANDPATQHLN